MWKTRDIKSEARRALKANYLVCFIACLALGFVMGGPMSMSENANTNILVMKLIATETKGTPAAEAINKLVDGAERFKKSTSLGEDATKGRIGNVYRKIAAANGINGLLANTINKHIARGKLHPPVVELMSLAIAILIYLFIAGSIEIGLARMFLETRRDPATRLLRIFFIFRIGRMRRIAVIMLLRAVYLTLWGFTIVGLPIKYYSYRLVPYIVAENPDIGYKEAFAMSIRLMRGNKMRMFLFDLSFIPLFLLSILTVGIAGYVWLTPYYNASKAEIYATLRGADLTLKDGEYRKPPAWLDELLSHVGAKPQYSYINIAFMFIFFAFVGWVFECSIFLIEDGLLVNRGTTYGPWIPIYGFGGVAIIAIVNRFYKKPLACFFMIIAVCAPIEYFGAWILWETRHLKYWDYSDYFLNFQGRVCLEGLLNFAVLGILGIYIIAPVIDTLLNRIPIKTRRAICAVLYAAFLADMTCAQIWPHTGKGITNELS